MSDLTQKIYNFFHEIGDDLIDNGYILKDMTLDEFADECLITTLHKWSDIVLQTTEEF